MSDHTIRNATWDGTPSYVRAGVPVKYSYLIKPATHGFQRYIHDRNKGLKRTPALVKHRDIGEPSRLT